MNYDVVWKFIFILQFLYLMSALVRLRVKSDVGFLVWAWWIVRMTWVKIHVYPIVMSLGYNSARFWVRSSEDFFHHIPLIGTPYDKICGYFVILFSRLKCGAVPDQLQFWVPYYESLWTVYDLGWKFMFTLYSVSLAYGLARFKIIIGFVNVIIMCTQYNFWWKFMFVL